MKKTERKAYLEGVESAFVSMSLFLALNTFCGSLILISGWGEQVRSQMMAAGPVFWLVVMWAQAALGLIALFSTLGLLGAMEGRRVDFTRLSESFVFTAFSAAFALAGIVVGVNHPVLLILVVFFGIVGIAKLFVSFRR